MLIFLHFAPQPIKLLMDTRVEGGRSMILLSVFPEG